MRIELSIFWTVILNFTVWPVIQLSLAWGFGRVRQDRFNPALRVFRTATWEYVLLAGVRRWKHLLPDAAPWIGGFPKKHLKNQDAIYLTHFARETCRAELAHWLMVVAVVVFFFWNPLWADGVMIVYAVFANLPCILAQRYNRLRLMRVLMNPKKRISG